MFANLIAYWLIGLPAGYVLCFRFGWGALGVWIGLCAGLVMIGSALLFTWHKRLAQGGFLAQGAISSYGGADTP
jgi:MATE family multidrug resistance protein